MAWALFSALSEKRSFFMKKEVVFWGEVQESSLSEEPPFFSALSFFGLQPRFGDKLLII